MLSLKKTIFPSLFAERFSILKEEILESWIFMLILGLASTETVDSSAPDLAEATVKSERATTLLEQY